MLKKIAKNFCVTLLGKKIFPVLSAKDLGMTLDSHLNYNEHVCKRTASLCPINRVIHLLNKKSLLTAIYIYSFFMLNYAL